MVVFVDLEQDAHDFHDIPRRRAGLDRPVCTGSPVFPDSIARRSEEQQRETDQETFANTRANPNVNGFSAALGCYPIAKELARSIDLNTLHALSRTCRQIRLNLLQFRHQLIRETICCENEDTRRVPRRDGNILATPNITDVLHLLADEREGSRKLASGKIGQCARDMVMECKKCSRVVCRNCAAKPPPSPMLKNRHRRLCSACRVATISSHIVSPSPFSDEGAPAFTAVAFVRGPCSCEDGVWLCQACGNSLRNDDTTYRRVWTWRSRYSTHIGGLGTGIGEGNQGVKCGRGEHCRAAKDIEVEIDCCADEFAAIDPELSFSQHATKFPDASPTEIRDEEGPGYLRQEIVGIGGAVKRKVKKRIRVGAAVREYDDERVKAVYLEREALRRDRSWCGWCDRVILGTKDLDAETSRQSP